MQYRFVFKVKYLKLSQQPLFHLLLLELLFWRLAGAPLLLLVFGVLGTIPFVMGAIPVLPGGGGRGMSSIDSPGGLAYMSMLFDLLFRTEVEKPYLLSPPP
jgi:hypothetical protein